MNYYIFFSTQVIRINTTTKVLDANYGGINIGNFRPYVQNLFTDNSLLLFDISEFPSILSPDGQTLIPNVGLDLLNVGEYPVFILIGGLEPIENLYTFILVGIESPEPLYASALTNSNGVITKFTPHVLDKGPLLMSIPLQDFNLGIVGDFFSRSMMAYKLTHDYDYKFPTEIEVDYYAKANAFHKAIICPSSIYIPEDIIMTFNKAFGYYEVLYKFDPDTNTYIDYATLIKQDLRIPLLGEDSVLFQTSNDIVIVSINDTNFEMYDISNGVVNISTEILPPDSEKDAYFGEIYYSGTVSSFSSQGGVICRLRGNSLNYITDLNKGVVTIENLDPTGEFYAIEKINEESFYICTLNTVSYEFFMLATYNTTTEILTLIKSSGLELGLEAGDLYYQSIMNSTIEEDIVAGILTNETPVSSPKK